MSARHASVLGMVAGLFGVSAAAQSQVDPTGLHSVGSPIRSGYLKASDIHEIYYALHGNPEGKPVFVLHGGPGVGCYPRLMQYFAPDEFLVVLHDQRGAGRSRPAGEIRENSLGYLVADIKRLREYLGITVKALVFGGSWGSTLALAYAEAHPERVRGVIVRGVFTVCADEPLNGFVGPIPRLFFPDAAAAFDAALPAEYRAFEPKRLLELFSGYDEATQRRVAEAWIRCVIRTGKLHVSDKEMKAGWGEYDAVPGARIECHYAANGFFLEPGQLLRDADTLQEIPVAIINGRYDLICPPMAAWRLHERLPKSRLVIVEEAGHSESEPGITAALLEAVRTFE